MNLFAGNACSCTLTFPFQQNQYFVYLLKVGRKFFWGKTEREVDITYKLV